MKQCFHREDYSKLISRTFFLISFTGIHSVAYAFPNVRIVTGAVDTELNDSFHIIPGVGKFRSIEILSEQYIRACAHFLLCLSACSSFINVACLVTKA